MTATAAPTKDASSSSSSRVSPFLDLGFRPLYLGGCLWAIVAVALWVFAPLALGGRLTGVAWHAHEMLWGFVATIAVGFLLTASATWTGLNPLHGRALGLLCGCWLVARIGFLVPGQGAFVVATIADLVFFAGAAIALGRSIGKARNRRNYGIPVLVAVLGLADGLFLVAVRAGDGPGWTAAFEGGMLAMTVVALLIGRRVIPFFAMRAIPSLEVPMSTRIGQAQLVTAVIAVGCGLAGQRVALAIALAVTGLIALGQVLAWKPAAVRRVPLLWILYAGYAGLGAGLVVAAIGIVDPALRRSWPIHLIGVGGFSVLIIGMVTRTALGHLGRPLRTDRLMVVVFGLVLVAAGLRLSALVPGAPWPGVIHGAAGAWMAGFGLWLWRFAPWLVRPRADRKSAR